MQHPESELSATGFLWTFLVDDNLVFYMRLAGLYCCRNVWVYVRMFLPPRFGVCNAPQFVENYIQIMSSFNHRPTRYAPWHVYTLVTHTISYLWQKSIPFSRCSSCVWNSPYPEPVYTGWSSVHWNTTGSPSVHWDTTGRPSEQLQGTLEHHWKNLVETAPHWNATG